MKINNLLIAFLGLLETLFLDLFEFQEVIVECKKAFVPNLKVLQGGSITRLFITNLVQILKYRVRVTRKAFLYNLNFLS